MSDKGFGDPAGRSVLKNPLLSTAVTGLSIEDLTHNAVLLPVARSQELVTGRDQSTGPQNRTPGNSDLNVTNIITGDVNSNVTPSCITPSTTPSLPGTKQDENKSKINYPPMSTTSKASAKSEDDFDVNEYFARLQGTRYVSAPINSLLKEDNNANLQATEENLEEINLNEPDKTQLDVQQSLTADIAQNFSQLPTVLPQVASAVFSSFSNMLSMKSREVTPDETKPSVGYQAPSMRQEINVPLMGVDEPVKDMAPPPKEPPIGGTSNYRISTKKKAYAQIPGLSSRDPNINQYPSTQSCASSFSSPNPAVPDVQAPPERLFDNLKTHSSVIDRNKQKEIDLFHPVAVSTYSVEETQPSNNQPNIYAQKVDASGQISNSSGQNVNPSPTSVVRPNYLAQKVENIEKHPEGFNNAQASIAQPNTAIIPPPPMFSNMPRRDSNSGIGKSILPPSVARRISANHPIIKQQTSQGPIATGNIFVPATDNTHENSLGQIPPSFSQCQQQEAVIQPPLFNPVSATSQTECQLIDNSSFYQTSIQPPVGSSIPPTATSQPSISTILPPPPSKAAAPEAQSELQAHDTLNTTSVVPSTSSSTSSAFNQPVVMPPPPTKPIGPPPKSKPLSSIFQATPKPTNLPPPPTNIFTPVFSTDKSQKVPCTNQEKIGMDTPIGIQTQGSVFSSLSPPSKLDTLANVTVSPENIFQPSLSVKPPTVLSQLPATTNTPNVPTIQTPPSIESNIQETASSLPPPPTFYNPNTMQAQNSEESKPQSTITQCFTSPPEPEPPKPVAEPPKLTGNVNYRMTKKRPQYYSGPIEGVGSISNNIKPVLPEANPSSFHGALFTPTQIQDQELVAPYVEQACVPQTYNPFDISKPVQQSLEASYSTAFDLSRQTTDAYDPPKQETKGFGIIGSLKSKLGSFDINKIQNSVTTFFDPAYNDTKKDAQEYKPYEHQAYYGYSQQENLGICIEQNPDAYSQYNYQTNHQNQPYSYGGNNQYYHTQEYFYQNQSQMYPSCTDFNQMYTTVAHHQSYDTSMFANTSNMAERGNILQENVGNNNASGESTKVTDVLEAARNINDVEDDQSVLSASSSVHALIPGYNKGETDLLAKRFFDSSPSIPDLIPKVEGMDLHSNIVTSEGDIKEHDLVREKSEFDLRQNEVPLTERVDEQGQNDSISVKYNKIFTGFSSEENKEKTDIGQTNFTPRGTDKTEDIKLNTSPNRQETESVKLENAFANYTFDTDSNDKDLFTTMQRKNDFKNDSLSDSFPTTVSAVPLFDLSSMIADKSKDMEDLSETIKNVSLYELSKKEAKRSEDFDREASVSFSENDLENKPLLEDSQEEDSVSEFNICETCREVNKPETEEEKAVDDLTTQLIENIIAPIQLSNPVGAPLTPDEETAESIPVQSATKLLEDDITEQDTVNYGWHTDDTNSASKGLFDNMYSYHTTSHVIGCYSGNSTLFDEVPCNASDEIKAELKHSQDDNQAAVVLPRQMSVPSAPPASDDDSKSDETGGLDVHSIEQDAKKDFPLFEEFVIDPSETDDDKIEVRERERSSDDPIPDADTFTNRVERFKKMGESSDDLFDAQKKIDIVTSVSPAITIASYFDTGNYAAETHYKNSLSSSSPFSQVNINSPNITTRVPPGFENDFQRRLSGLSSDSLGQYNNEPYIPETATQTKVTTTTSYSSAGNAQNTFTKTTEQTMLPCMYDYQSCFSGFSSDTFGQNKNEPSIPETSTQARVTTTTSYSTAGNIHNTFTKTTEQTQETVAEKLPPFATIFGVDKASAHTKETSADKSEDNASQIPSLFGLQPVRLEGGDAASVFADKSPVETLPDPLSFFSSKEEPKEETDNSFNRLASYFSSPTKTDPAKSFFELSQSQNHYRHASNQESNSNNNIPNSLINDLTSCQNIINKERIVRTVNYFTVEYNNNNVNELKVNEPTYKDNIEDVVHYNKEVEEINNNDLMNVVRSCSDCCNNSKSNLYRKVMDNDNSDRKGPKMNAYELKDGKHVNRDVKFNFNSSDDADEGVSILTETRQSMDYTPVRHHWFYRVDCEAKSVWRGFSLADSKALEEAFHSPNLNENTLVATDGGRYDVNIIGRLRVAVYWSDKPTNVRRCSWFYKGNTDARYVPYTEAVAEKLEEEYRHGVTTGEWHRRLILPNNELVVMHGPAVMVHLLQTTSDAFSSTPLLSFGKRVYRNPPKFRVPRDVRPSIDHLIFMVHGAGEYSRQQEKSQSTMRPRVVRRGWDESEIEDSEPSKIDHLLLLCHGVGSACDMRFRSVEEVVDDFRATSLQLLQSHYRNSYDNGVVNRVEVLPISWHSTLHTGELGVDRRLSEITLESIPRLRNFTNDTVLDVLFYTSPLYSQTIIKTVCAELNRIYNLFKSRNPSFHGTVSLGGHSLGSVILYDLLCHQQSSGTSPPKLMVSGETYDKSCIQYPLLEFEPAALYALGSPIAMFECIRGVDLLGDNFHLPTCTHFFNIFHPYDPIAYRIEPLINRQLKDVKPFLIPHHKGRKRMHLELKDTMARVGADLKQKLIESLKSTWTSMWKTSAPPNDGQLEKVVEEEMEKELHEDSKEETPQEEVTPELLGKLNSGRRVDYVLQEAPFEMINEYLFAMSSHVCYWESEDTMLLMLREIYDALGVPPDCSVPQQSMTVQRSRTDMKEEASVAATEPSTSRGSS